MDINKEELRQLLAEKHFLPVHEYKELDDLMAYILDDLCDSQDKGIIRDGIIAYTELWHKKQNDEIFKLICKNIDYKKAP